MREVKEFDVVFVGATGFTGQLVIEYVYKQYGVGKSLNWAIAGRNASKLSVVAREILGDEHLQLPVIVAESTDGKAMDDLAKRTRVICTTVGPYAIYGNELVRACAEQGTDYCDLTGEVNWMRRMIDRHETRARASGARIVFTCGYDSIPSDLGVLFAQNQMMAKYQEYATEIKCRIGKTKGGMSGGTVASMLNMLEEIRLDPSIKAQLADPYGLNPVNTPAGVDKRDQVSAKFDPDFNQWTAPFVMAMINTRVVRRSHALMKYPYSPSFSYDESMLTGGGLGGFLRASFIVGVSGLMNLFLAFGPIRSMLAPLLPEPGTGPDEDTRINGFFNLEFLAKGNHWLKVKVAGEGDPGYGATSKMLVESAICLAVDELETPGGIWTPAAAMGDRLIARLEEKAGMVFEVVGHG